MGITVAEGKDARPSRRCTMQKAWTRIQAFSLAVREGIRCAHPAGRRWRSKRRRFVEPCRGFSPLSAVHHAKSLDANPGFLFEFGGERGLIRCAHPAGRRWRSKRRRFVEPCRGFSPLGGAPCKKPGRESRLSFEFGGERGFEPSIHFRVYTLSRRAPSATRHLTVLLPETLCAVDGR